MHPVHRLRLRESAWNTHSKHEPLQSAYNNRCCLFPLDRHLRSHYAVLCPGHHHRCSFYPPGWHSLSLHAGLQGRSYHSCQSMWVNCLSLSTGKQRAKPQFYEMKTFLLQQCSGTRRSMDALIKCASENCLHHTHVHILHHSSTAGHNLGCCHTSCSAQAHEHVLNTSGGVRHSRCR